MKKILSLVLAMLMILSTVPLTTLAEELKGGESEWLEEAPEFLEENEAVSEEGEFVPETEPETSGKDEITSEIEPETPEEDATVYTEAKEDLLFADPQIVASGFCGRDTTEEWDEASDARKNLWWTLDSEGTLTIGGEGAMRNYGWDTYDSVKDRLITGAPWGQYVDQLKTLVIEEDVTSIGKYAFYNCSGFTGDLVIGNSVTSIGGSAFYGCSGFTGNLVIPDSVTSIGEDAFEYCSGFTGDLVIPDSVTSIGNYAFRGCSGFTGDLVIPNGVTNIGGSVFFGCSGFTGDLVIPNSVTSIGEWAFYGCSGFTGNLVIPNSVTSIGERAFLVCSGFTGDLVIGDSVKSIGEYAFAGTGFENVYFEGDAPEVTEATDEGNASFEPDVTLYYLEGKFGWTSPTWNGYQTEIYDPDDSEAKKWLRERGFYNYWDENTEIITDFENDDLSLEVVFGENDDFGDKITAEFIDDILTVTIHDVSAEQWEKAYCPGLQNIIAHIFWSFPEDVLADQWCGNRDFEKWYKDELSDSENFIYSRNWGNGAEIAHFFRHGDRVTAVPQEFGNHYLIIAYVEGEEINYKVLVFRVVLADDAEAVTFDDPYKSVFVPINRINAYATSEKLQPLIGEYANGILVYSYNGGKTTVEEITSDLNIQDCNWTLNHVIVSAPDGYVLDGLLRDDFKWSEKKENVTSADLEFPFGEDGNIWTKDMTYIIAWRSKDDGRIIHETLTVHNDFGKEFNPLDIYWDPVPAERVVYYSWDEEIYLTAEDLEEYGILTNYSEETGCVRTKFSEDPDLLSLGECLAVVTPPEGAVYYRRNHSGGSKAKIYWKEDAEEQKWYIENFDYELVSDMPDLNVNVIVSQGRTVEVNGKEYIYQRAAEDEIYRCVVEWYDENKNLIAGEYLYDIVDPYFAKAKEIVASGFCGGDTTAAYNADSEAYENLWWTLDSEGTLTIGGEGAMQNYDIISDSMAPWSQYNNQLKTLVIKDGVTSIGEWAFGGSGFTGNLVIPDSVTSIGDDAFFGCSGFTGNLVIPNSVTNIGTQAFYNCSGFTGDLVIPNSVTSIGANPFGFCPGLENILVSDNNPYYSSKDGILYNKDQTILLACPTGKTGTMTIPNSVTSIGEGAFYCCSGFTGNLMLPDSVTSIGEWAFAGCSGFTGDLVIPNSVTSIGNYAFAGCFGFTGDLVIPDSVTSIGNSAFEGCSGFTGDLVIGNSVTSIGEGAFFGCSGFTGDLVIPNSVTYIGYGAFVGCSGFTGNLVIGNSVTSIRNSAFEGCSGFTGDLVIPNSVTSIGEWAFYGCSGFTGNLVIPNSVTSIGDGAFSYCTGFTGDLVIGNSVTSIGDYAFRGCSGFTGDLVIGNSVTSIGDYAFQGCSGLKGIYFKGDAPTVVEADEVEASFDSDTTICYIEGKSGWTSPTWNGYTTKIWSGLSATLDISSTVVTENKAGMVSLTLGENSGVAAMQMALTYDAEKLILESSELGENFVGKGFEINANIPGQVIIAWDDTEPMTMGGTLLDLTFHAKEGAEFGEVPISIPIDDDFVFVDEKHHDILLKVNTGTVEICDVLLGDVNEDGKINILDANIVRRSSAKLLILDDKQKLAADVNGDGSINVIDANLIRRYAAKLITDFSQVV